MRIRQSSCSHTYPREGHRSPGGRSSWKLEFRGCGAIPGQGPLLTAERRIKGMWGRLWWEMPVEESQAAMKVRWYCSVMHGGGAITIASLSPHASIGSWTIESLANQKPDALSYRVGPHPGCPFKGLMHGSIEQDPSHRAPLCAWHGKKQRTPGKGVL